MIVSIVFNSIHQFIVCTSYLKLLSPVLEWYCKSFVIISSHRYLYNIYFGDSCIRGRKTI
ncbi:hypothetical protein MOSE0_J02190 [Monosporozyma servazzii]